MLNWRNSIASRILCSFVGLGCMLLAETGRAQDEPAIPNLNSLCGQDIQDDYAQQYQEAIGIACVALHLAHKKPLDGQRVVIELPSRLLLPAHFVRRMLLLPNILPETALGGLEIDGGTIYGQLTIRRARIKFSVVFQNVTFLMSSDKVKKGRSIYNIRRSREALKSGDHPLKTPRFLSTKVRFAMIFS